VQSPDVLLQDELLC